MVRIVIFASGSGTNAENIIKYFKNKENVNVKYVLTNNKNAKVIDRANKLNIPSIIFSKEELKSDKLLLFLQKETDLIILAGFLLKIPDQILVAFPNKIINIHPALLPKYGGKGMYGMHVHRAVISNKETKSGITIHFVNENYDEGAIIFQKEVALSYNDTPEDVASKIHVLEQENFPGVIEDIIYKNYL